MNFVDLEYENRDSTLESLSRLIEIRETGKYLMGKNVDELEVEFSSDQGYQNCVLVKNATDALALTFMHLNARERTVIVPQFGAYPTVMAALQAGAKNIIACSIDKSMTMDITSIDVPRGSIIVPVNLYGNSCNMSTIKKYADLAGDCIIVEDCAQSTGLKNSGLSDYAIHSFYPTKPMGCMGDGGAILTNDQSAALQLRKSRFYGLDSEGLIRTWGINSRIDEWQAAHLLCKVNHYRKMNHKRRENAKRYSEFGVGISYSSDCVYHQYVEIYAERDSVRQAFTEAGIPTMIHYPKMLINMPYLSDRVKFSNCKNVSKHVLSLPVGPHLTSDELEKISQVIYSVSDRRINFEDIL